MKKKFRHTILTSFSYIIISIVSAGYGLLIARFFTGQPVDQDAFFLAYTVFSALMMFSGTLRISVVPMLSDHSGTETGAVAHYGEIAISVGLCFLAAAFLVGILWKPLGEFLGYGFSSEGRRMTSLALLAFSPAIFFQGMTQFFGAALGAIGDFDFVSASASVSSIAGLLIFLLSAKIGIFSVVLGLSAFNLFYACSQWHRARSIGMVVLREDWHLISITKIFQILKTIFRSSSIYLAFNIAYIICQSLSTTFPSGTPTAFAYAYMITTMTILVTTGAMGITLTDRYRDYTLGPTELFRDFVVEHAAISGLIASACIGLLTVLALPLGSFIFTILPAGSTLAEIGNEKAVLFTKSVWSLTIGGWGMAIFAVLTPAAIAARRTRHFTVYAVTILSLQLFAIVVLKRIFGLIGLGISFSLTALLLSSFPAIKLLPIFGWVFVRSMLRRLLISAGTGIAAATCTILVHRTMHPVSSWPIKLTVSVLLFSSLYFAGTFFLERSSWNALLSHFKRRSD
ncbi:lipid II flippase MurJ [Thermodesulfobacteriota bacterium]